MTIPIGRASILPSTGCKTEFYNVQKGTLTVSETRTLVGIRYPRRDRAIAHNVFAWENEALAQLSHPNVLEFYGTTTVGSTLCAVTAWAEEGDLREYLTAHPEADRRCILLQVATGLEYLHSSSSSKTQVVHGNLHITNILMQNGVPRISDFAYSVYRPGRARQPHLVDKVGPMGHATSLAPEIIASGLRTAESDVYAFGMLLFETYAGRGPFSELPRRHGVPFAAAAQLGTGKRPPRSAVTRSDFMEDLWRLTTHCWAHDARARPPAAEVRARLAAG